ncbi:MAG: hypothetical protein HPY64_04300 [Anaerolineae bacterium]|nr:hypothetical protein [Anaerolineae bacterium]
MTDPSDIPTEVIAETEHYQVWVSEEPDGELVYHVELGLVTIHLFAEEFEEFVQLIKRVKKA